MLQVVKSTFIGKLVLKYIVKKILRDSWGGAASGPALGLARMRLPPNCPAVPQRVRIERRKWGSLECQSTLGGGDS